MISKYVLKNSIFLKVYKLFFFLRNCRFYIIKELYREFPYTHSTVYAFLFRHSSTYNIIHIKKDYIPEENAILHVGK